MSFNRSFDKLTVCGLQIFTGDSDYEDAPVPLFVPGELSSDDLLCATGSSVLDGSCEHWRVFAFFLFFWALLGMFFFDTILVSELLPFATFLNMASISISLA